MSKIHPHLVAPPSPPSSSSSSSSSSSDVCFFERHTFTIWMKSLVLEGKGCAVFNSKGQVVYRVDNYNSKCCDKHKVLLMDSHGRVLLTILRKFRLLTDWEGYREENTKGASWWFRVQKSWRLTKKLFRCEITVNLDHNNESSTVKIEKGKGKLSSCRIVDKSRGLLAEMKRKQSIEGVFFGNDVLTMVIEPNVDHSLIMGLMVAHGLIECRI